MRQVTITRFYQYKDESTGGILVKVETGSETYSRFYVDIYAGLVAAGNALDIDSWPVSPNEDCHCGGKLRMVGGTKVCEECGFHISE